MPDETEWSPTVYRELRLLAERLLAGERNGHTLQPTALTHEVWLRLQNSRNAGELDHRAFLGLAAQSMRRILTEHARRRGARKRGGEARRTTLDGKSLRAASADFVLDLEEALGALEGIDPELARAEALARRAGDPAQLARALHRKGFTDDTVEAALRIAGSRE